MKNLIPINNRCRCGAVAEGIKEETVDSSGDNPSGKCISTRIVASSCKECGLKYVADDMRATLTPAFQSLIRKTL